MTADRLPPPPDVLRRRPKDIVLHRAPVWRVQHDSTDPARAWDRLRHYGPVTDQRCDPHDGPKGAGKTAGVQYLAANPIAAIGEVFQDRAIPTADPSWVLYGWQPIRPLRLLDLTGTFGSRNGAAAIFSTSRDKRRTRAWARAVDTQFPDLDGISYDSKVTGFPAIALLTAAETDPPWPSSPQFAREFTSASMRRILLTAADELGYTLLP